MNSNRHDPILLSRLINWILDSGQTPILAINSDAENTKLPPKFRSCGIIHFNVSPVAIRQLHIDHERIQFVASFSQEPHAISIPLDAVIDIFADEDHSISLESLNANTLNVLDKIIGKKTE